ncbi:MAG: pantetheine-phosphate adenylyltransferase [Clostridia bacterium]|nr:pantetheine-phosphate adenylyltransferase [Clostridia bacterium]
MRIAVYPGSFDPITNGHLDIIKRASRLYDKVIVGVLNNASKSPVFTAEERKQMIDEATEGIDNVSCDIFSGLLVDFAKQNHATVIIKGLRTVADFEYEFQMALLNKALNPEYETVFMMTDSKFSYISSSMVKEVAKYHGQLEGLVPERTADKIMKKF